MRVEILPSGKRRCHWSPEEKARIVAETLAAGATVAEVARKHEISPGRIFAWRREARAKENGGPAALGLVKVHVAAPAPAFVMDDMPANSTLRTQGSSSDESFPGKVLFFLDFFSLGSSSDELAKPHCLNGTGLRHSAICVNPPAQLAAEI
jgi:transposase-like protein